MRIAAEIALKASAEDLLAQAQQQAPVETGALRASGRVEMGERDGIPTATVSFNTVYAARQHEEITWKHPRGGKAKYLEDPLKQMAHRYQLAIAAAVRRALR